MIRLLKSLLLAVLLFQCAFAASQPSARDLIAAGRIDDAIAELNARIAANPNDSEAYHLLSRAYYAVERWDAAISNEDRAVALAPNNSDYHMWLGRAYGEKAGTANVFAAPGFAKKARDQFEKAVQLNGRNSGARRDLAEYYVGAPGFLGGGKDKARAQADQIIASDPAAAHWIRAIVADKEKQYDIAEQELKDAIKSSKSPASQWLDLASFYRRRSRLDDMEQAVYSALKVPNRPLVTLYDAAEILHRGGRNFSGAIQLLREYLRSGDPSEDSPLFEAHYLLGILLEKTGDRAGAVAEYRATLSLARDFQKAQTALKRVQ